MQPLKELTARLERVEERAKELNLAYAWQASRPTAAAENQLELQVEAQAQTLESLRQDLRAAEAEHARQVQLLQAEWQQASAELPRLLEAAGAPDKQDAVRRQTAYMQKRFREQFDAALEEHVAARTRAIEAQLNGAQSALAQLEKQAAANEEQLTALRTTFANLSLDAARTPEWNTTAEPAAPRPWHKTWRLPALALALVVLALVAWQFLKAPAVTSEAALLDQAGEAAVQKDYPRAENIYRDVLKKNPKQEEALRGLGNALLLESESVMHTLPPP